MIDRMREVVGKHSTYYVCDEHGWDFTNVDKDVCPVCYGESLAEARIIKLLQHEYLEMPGLEYEHFEDACVTCENIALIKGEK
jgi:hypothetical protein